MIPDAHASANDTSTDMSPSMTTQPDEHRDPEQDQDDERGLDRRGFLRVGALLGACFTDPKALRAALVYAKAQGKPVLTQTTLNRFIQNAFKQPAAVRQQMAAEAKANIGAFLAKHFALNTQQKHVVSTLSSAETSTLHKAIDQAIREQKPMQVIFKPAQHDSPHAPVRSREPMRPHVSPNAPAYKQHQLEARQSKAGAKAGPTRDAGTPGISAAKKAAPGAMQNRLDIQMTADVGPKGPSAGVTVTAHLC